MKFSLGAIALALGTANAAYSGDIVQYWADQTSALVNNTIIGGIQSPPSSWGPAIVHGAILLAAQNSKGKSLEFQQLAVSHAAHNSLIWFFHGTRNYAATSAALRSIASRIGIPASSSDSAAATKIGREAARRAVVARADDGNNDFVDYAYGPADPGVYQQTPGGNAFPDVPHSRFVKLFAAVGDVKEFDVGPPPSTSDPKYEKYLLEVKGLGERNSTTRTKFQTETAYIWRESSIAGWTRIASSVIGTSLAKDVYASAKFYAQLQYALANAAIASWDSKYKYNSWRPVTAIRYPTIWLSTGKNVSSPGWTPLLATPSHPDYTSTHATFGAAAAQVIRSHTGKDTVSFTYSSNVTIDNVGVLTRRYTNLTYAVEENADSRIYGGIHFTFAKLGGIKQGTEVALATLENFDRNWDKF